MNHKHELHYSTDCMPVYGTENAFPNQKKLRLTKNDFSCVSLENNNNSFPNSYSLFENNSFSIIGYEDVNSNTSFDPKFINNGRQFSAVDLKHFLQKIVRAFQPQAALKGLGLDLAVPSEELSVELDCKQVEQMLADILSIAITTTSRGSISLTGNKLCMQDASLWIKFEVCCPVMVPEGQKNQNLISFAESFGGTLRINRELDEGTKFSFKIPFKPGVVKKEELHSSTESFLGSGSDIETIPLPLNNTQSIDSSTQCNQVLLRHYLKKGTGKRRGHVKAVEELRTADQCQEIVVNRQLHPTPFFTSHRGTIHASIEVEMTNGKETTRQPIQQVYSLAETEGTLEHHLISELVIPMQGIVEITFYYKTISDSQEHSIKMQHPIFVASHTSQLPSRKCRLTNVFPSRQLAGQSIAVDIKGTFSENAVYSVTFGNHAAIITEVKQSHLKVLSPILPAGFVDVEVYANNVRIGEPSSYEYYNLLDFDIPLNDQASKLPNNRELDEFQVFSPLGTEDCENKTASIQNFLEACFRSQLALQEDMNEMFDLYAQEAPGFNVQDSTGRTPLSWAVQRGHTAIVKFLVKAGADLDLADFHGITPLLDAMIVGHFHIARMLLEAGANPDCKAFDEFDIIECSGFNEQDFNTCFGKFMKRPKKEPSDHIPSEESQDLPVEVSSHDTNNTGNLDYEVERAFKDNPPGGPTRQIFIQNLQGSSIVVEVNSLTTIGCIKHKIQEKEGIAVEYQVLTYAGKPLEDMKQIGHYNIPPQATLHLYCRLRGGKITFSPTNNEQYCGTDRHNYYIRQIKHGIAVSDAVYGADEGNHCIRKIKDGKTKDATFTESWGITMDRNGDLYITKNDRIRKINIGSGTVETIAGSTGSQDDYGYHDGEFNRPTGLALSDDGTTIYVCDRVRQIKNGVVSTLAGTPGKTGYKDATLRHSTIETLRHSKLSVLGLAMTGDGCIPITHRKIFRVDIPESTPQYLQVITDPFSLTIDNQGNIYCGTVLHELCKITSLGSESHIKSSLNNTATCRLLSVCLLHALKSSYLESIADTWQSSTIIRTFSAMTDLLDNNTGPQKLSSTQTELQKTNKPIYKDILKIWETLAGIQHKMVFISVFVPQQIKERVPAVANRILADESSPLEQNFFQFMRKNRGLENKLSELICTLEAELKEAKPVIDIMEITKEEEKLDQVLQEYKLDSRLTRESFQTGSFAN